MSRALAFLVAASLGTGPFAGLSHARPPQKLEPFWAGLPAGATVASSGGGVVALTVAPGGRIRIPGGSFVMGSTLEEMAEAMQLCAKEPLGVVCQQNDPRLIFTPQQMIRAEFHPHEVTLSTFELDVTEVTVEAYDRCVSAGACGRPGYPLGDPRYDQARFPVTHVTWEDANEYCTWVGARLPTEAEWEYAARSQVNNTFPWGKTYNPHLANHGATLAHDNTDGSDGFYGLAPVGSFPDGATPAGVLDLAGNASEWVFDFYDRDDQAFGYPLGAQTNPANGQYTPYGHVVRGGSYLDGAFMLRAAARSVSLGGASRTVGFRCAATPTPR